MDESSYSEFKRDFQQIQKNSQSIGVSNGWVDYENGEFYIRFGRKQIDGESVTCLQIANVSVPVEHEKGIFLRFVGDVTDLCDLPIYVENILSPKFSDYLRKHGFSLVSPPDEMPCLLYGRVK